MNGQQTSSSWFGKMLLIGLLGALAGWGINELAVWQLDRAAPRVEQQPRPVPTPRQLAEATPQPVEEAAPPAVEGVVEVAPAESPTPGEPEAAGPSKAKASADSKPKARKPRATKPAPEKTRPSPEQPEIRIYELDRAALKAQFRSPADLAGHGRILPNYEDGERRGMKIADVAPGGIFARLGIESGDVIVSVNGKKITTQPKAMADLEAMKKARSFIVVFEREGRERRHKYLLE